jgi:hypothetical protein
MEPAPCRQLRNEPSGDRPGGFFLAAAFRLRMRRQPARQAPQNQQEVVIGTAPALEQSLGCTSTEPDVTTRMVLSRRSSIARLESAPPPEQPVSVAWRAFDLGALLGLVNELPNVIHCSQARHFSDGF